MEGWLIEDQQGLSALDGPILRNGGTEEPLPGPIALRLHDIVIHSNKRWFDFLGGADIRVDVLAVQGNVLDDDPKSFYTPTTVRFGGIGDESTVPLDEHGLLAYYGWPKHFLDISVLVSRDTHARRRPGHAVGAAGSLHRVQGRRQFDPCPRHGCWCARRQECGVRGGHARRCRVQDPAPGQWQHDRRVPGKPVGVPPSVRSRPQPGGGSLSGPTTLVVVRRHHRRRGSSSRFLTARATGSRVRSAGSNESSQHPQRAHAIGQRVSP